MTIQWEEKVHTLSVYLRLWEQCSSYCSNAMAEMGSSGRTVTHSIDSALHMPCCNIQWIQLVDHHHDIQGLCVCMYLCV